MATKQIEVELDVTVHHEDDMYWAEVPSHPGLFASGETMDELVEALAEAWVLYSCEDAHTSEHALERPSATAATQSMQVLVHC